MMYLILLSVTFMLQGILVNGIDLNSIFGRLICFDYEQENCNTSFVDKYPELSRSVTNMTVAETFMLLYTDGDLDNPEVLNKCGGRLPPDSKFNPENPTIVIFIPFIAQFCQVAVYREWVVQLQKCGVYNIIVIDYGWGQNLDYYTAVLNAQDIVRYQTVILLKNIEEQIGAPFKNLTFIGHSLGAQLGGMVGALYPTYRIIGIDPAGPAFDQNKTSLFDRLDPSDADLVEVWHTNAGACLPFLGIDYEAGHVNFYINGGSVQKTCYPYGFESILKRDYFYGFGTLLLPTTCWHAQAAAYFKVSICPTDCRFVGVKCNSKIDFKLGKCRSCGPTGENCLIMGFDTPKYLKEIPSTPQVYYVKTTLFCPWCDNDYVNLEGYKDTYESSFQ